MSSYTPREFSSTSPPPRIIGTEMEYIVPSHHEISSGFENAIIDAAKYLTQSSYGTDFMHTGARLYHDVGHIEYATAECLGPRQAACADIAGQLTVAAAAEFVAGDEDGLSVYRRTGFAHSGSEESVGYHQNFLTPKYKTHTEQLRDAHVIASYLATRVIWSGSGMLADHFSLSQKAHGIAQHDHGIALIGKYGENRTRDHSKPLLIWSHGAHGSVESHAAGWERLEVRHADAVHSPWVRYMALATTSLVLRILEQRQLLHDDDYDSLTVASLAETTHVSSEDTTFQEPVPLKSGDVTTALELQREFAQKAINLAAKHAITLPPDELHAAIEWLRICDDLEQVDFSHPDSLKHIADRVEWAARYTAICKYAGNKLLSRDNARAVKIDLAWDQIYPHSFAEKVWKKRQPDFFAVHNEEIYQLMRDPPRHTRAFQRARLLRAGGSCPSDHGWSQVLTRDGDVANLIDPYDYGN